MTESILTMKKIYIFIILLAVASSLPAQSYRAIHLGGNWGYNWNFITNTNPSHYPDDFIQFLHDTNVEWVGLSVSIHVDNSMDSTVELSYTATIPTFTDVALTETLSWLKANGLKTYVTLAFELENPESMDYPVARWQLGDPYMPDEDSTILSENWPWALDHPNHDQFVSSFFESYAESAMHIATICENEGVDIFSLGTETERLFRTRSGDSWENHYLNGLTLVKENVRSVFSGLITYDMHADAIISRDFYGAGSDHLWEDLDLDIVGISAYFSLVDEEPQEVLSEEFFLTSWENIFDDYLIPLKKRNLDRPIIFLEYGYVNSIVSPFEPSDPGESEDYVFTDSNGNGLDDGEEVQANIYSAFFKKLNENACIVEGAFLWGNEIIDQYWYDNDWNTRIHFGIRDKLVQDVVSSTYSIDHERPLPDIPVLGDSEPIFNQGSQSTFMVTPIENAIRYNWSITPENIGVLTVNDISVTIQWEDDASGEVEVFVNSENGCGVSENASRQVYINSAPTDIELSSNTIQENEEVGTIIGLLTTQDSDSFDTFTYSISQGNDNFQMDGDQLTSKVKFDFEEKATHSIEVASTDLNGLSISELFEITIIDVDDLVTGLDESNYEISLYPNPTRDYLIIKWNDFQEAIIFDLAGKVISKQKSKTLDLRSLNPGIYLMKLEGTNKESVVFRFLKE